MLFGNCRVIKKDKDIYYIYCQDKIIKISPDDTIQVICDPFYGDVNGTAYLRKLSYREFESSIDLEKHEFIDDLSYIHGIGKE